MPFLATKGSSIQRGSMTFKPLLLERFLQATPEELVKAHAYAYAGGLIRDIGYYPSEATSSLTWCITSAAASLS